jgi:glycosyltransferase involved in cell wall biosynthesis
VQQNSHGAAVVLSANPIYDTGGGQRSAQLALELLDRGFAVLFVSHGKVTETVDLGMRYEHERLRSVSLAEAVGDSVVVDRYLAHDRAVVITQVPVCTWEPVLARARAAGAVTVYDCIDRWDSELGRGWYRIDAERRIAKGSDILVASAAELVRHVEHLAERETSLLPNAYNSRVFRVGSRPERPADLPDRGRIALYVGALWGGWLDWSLVERAARALPDTTFVFVGDRRREGRGLPDNCVFLGLKPQTALPGYLAHADLAFLPWSADDVTQATSPLKVYEFVAMGLPVVGPAIETLRGIPGVRAFTDADDFVVAVRETGRKGVKPERVAEMEDFAAGNSWVQRVDALLSLAEPGPRRVQAPAVHTRRAMISVVVPAYNHARWISPAIESVRGQTLPAGEVIVVDDGSTDDTPDVVRELSFERLRYIRQSNRGAHAAINRGVALSRGDYVAILNSDDELTPERLEHAWGVARSTRAALVIGGVRLIDAEGAPLPADHESSRWYREAREALGASGPLARARLRHNVAVTTSNFFFHKELWRRLGGFAPYRYVHDYDFVLRALELCADRVTYAQAMETVLYRVHGANTILEDGPRAREERGSMLRHIRSPHRRWAAAMERPRAAAAVSRAVEAAEDPLPPVIATTVTHAPTRLGLVVASLDPGGLEEVVALLARTLPDHGLEPHVLCTHRGGPVARRLVAAGVDVRVAHGRRAEWRAWAADVAPDVLSTHFVDVAVVEEMASLGVPIWETVHNTYAWLERAGWEREAHKRALLTGTVAVSDLVARYYARFTGTERTPHVVPNGVHPARAAAVPRAWARKRLGLTEDQPVLAHLGRVTLQKNVLGLLRAFELLLEREPAARLVLAGSLSDRAYVRRARREHAALFRSGAARMLPPLPHVGTVLSAADAYVSNSFFEGWSLAASEAAWNGLPLVLSDCGSAAALVGRDGERGRIVPNPLGDPLEVTRDRLEAPSAGLLAANEREMAEAMREVLEDRSGWSTRRVAMAAAAREELAPGRVSRSYADLLRGTTAP